MFSKNTQAPTVAVITATVGRATLVSAIDSVEKQTFPCKHYIFVDGVDYWDSVRPLMKKYPNVVFTLLGMNSGRDKRYNGPINAILPYLIDEDIFCFLDDDNWHDENHVEYLVNMMVNHQLDYAYSLRRIYSESGEYLADDNYESLGFWQLNKSAKSEKNGLAFTISNDYLIDVNCYAIRREATFSLLNEWFIGWGNDRAVFKKLLSIPARGGCTGQRTTNYCWGHKCKDMLTYEQECELYSLLPKSPEEELPWLVPTLLINGELQVVGK